MYLPAALDSFALGHRAASHWVVPGSRLLRHSLADGALVRIWLVGRSRDKAAPLQTLGTNTPHQRAYPFENEVDEAPFILRLPTPN
jgi:hypothetical protein